MNSVFQNRVLHSPQRPLVPRPYFNLPPSTFVPPALSFFRSRLPQVVVDKSISPFYNVGERCNIAGSAAFKKLIMGGKYQDAMAVARKQVSQSAMEAGLRVYRYFASLTACCHKPSPSSRGFSLPLSPSFTPPPLSLRTPHLPRPLLSLTAGRGRRAGCGHQHGRRPAGRHQRHVQVPAHRSHREWDCRGSVIYCLRRNAAYFSYPVHSLSSYHYNNRPNLSSPFTPHILPAGARRVQGPLHDRLLQVRDRGGRPEEHAGQAHRELHLPQGEPVECLMGKPDFAGGLARVP